MKTIKLTNCDVDIKDRLSWIQKEEIEAVITSGAQADNTGIVGYDGKALLNAKIKTMELLIEEIRTGEKKEKFSRAWLESLDINDGDMLVVALDEVTMSKKK